MFESVRDVYMCARGFACMCVWGWGETLLVLRYSFIIVVVIIYSFIYLFIIGRAFTFLQEIFIVSPLPPPITNPSNVCVPLNRPTIIHSFYLYFYRPIRSPSSPSSLYQLLILSPISNPFYPSRSFCTSFPCDPYLSIHFHIHPSIHQDT